MNVGQVLVRDIPRQQFCDEVDGMFGDTRQNVPQVTLWIDSVQLCYPYQAVSTLAAPVRPSTNVRKVGHKRLALFTRFQIQPSGRCGVTSCLEALQRFGLVVKARNNF